MAWTTPRTWVAGEKPSAATWNTHLRDNLSYLANPAACRVKRGSVQGIADSTETTVNMDQEDYDTAAMHDNVTNNNRITIPSGWAGIFHITFDGRFAAGTDYTGVYALLRLNGTTVIDFDAKGTVADAGTNPAVKLGTDYKLSVGDYVEVRIWQNNTANATRNLTIGAFTARWCGLG